MASMLPALVQDLRLPWSPNVFATDGAQDFGYGGAQASCSPGRIRRLASAARQDDVAFLLSDAAEGKEADVSKVPLSFEDHKVKFSIASKVREHACKLEIGALAILVQQLTRSIRSHRSRTFCLVDSQPLRFAIIKGRSSAPHFRFGTRRIAALLLLLKFNFTLATRHRGRTMGIRQAEGSGCHLDYAARRRLSAAV